MRFSRVPKDDSISIRTAQGVDQPTKEPDGYRRYWTHCMIIICWALVVIAYLVVLHIAYKQTDHFGGKPASDKQILVYDILVFVRTILSTVHIPIMTGVLMSIVPWTMMEVSPRTPTLYSRLMHSALPRKTKLPELFYLSDATWGSAPGWFTALSTGIKVKAISWPWIHLSAVVFFSYLGFPLLSLAYRIDGENNFVSKQISVPSRLAYLPPGMANTLADNYFYYGSCTYCDSSTSLSSIGYGISLYRSPTFLTSTSSEYYGQLDSDGALITMQLASNVQVETVGLQISSSAAVYGVENRTFHDLYLYNDKSSTSNPPTFDSLFNTSSLGESESSKSILPSLQCSSCSGDDICQEKRSNRTLGNSYLIQNGTDNYLTALNFTDRYEGTSLSCVKISQSEESPMKATAVISMAIEGRGNYTKVATTSLTIAYALRTVNEATQLYIEPENSSMYAPENPDKDALSPAQLLNIVTTAFTEAFHLEVYNLSSNYPLITDGLIWVQARGGNFDSDWPTGDGQILDTWQSPAYMRNRTTNISRRGIFAFTESMLISPIGVLVGEPDFFRNDTTSAIVPGTVMYMRHGRVPVRLAITILILPILWTLILAILSTRDRRWTERLDSFSMFKLGSDYGGLLKEYKLSNLEETSKVLGKLSGIVLVTPQERKVELKPRKKARESAWEMELRHMSSTMTSKEQLRYDESMRKGVETSELDLTDANPGNTSHSRLLESDISLARQEDGVASTHSNGHESLLDSRKTSGDFDGKK